MRQGIQIVALCAALALITIAAPSPAPAGARAAASKSSTSSSTAKSRAKISLRQFTGTVTALDKTSITVAKGGKKPKTMVFSKHPEMHTQGDIDKDARVTVFYREEDGQPVAHRVVVKNAKNGKTGSANGR